MDYFVCSIVARCNCEMRLYKFVRYTVYNFMIVVSFATPRRQLFDNVQIYVSTARDGDH